MKQHKSSWVTCPICGIPDCHQEQDEEGYKTIFCTNHACKSNGGTYQDFSADKKTIAEKYGWQEESVDIDVEETRQLAASHGKDGMIIIAWTTGKDGIQYNTTTAGKQRHHAVQAASIRDWIMASLGLLQLQRVEDRIHEHTD